ncbi:MAG: glycosyl hydrolase family 18 protein [Sporolactobacillus sp.]|nr:glycosyl hydrolase family 18 protein [Sporolactobacillus sp.]
MGRAMALIIHVVRSKETLWNIANHYRTTVSALVAANRPTDPDRLAVGQSLVIPVPGAPGAKLAIDVNAYTYQPGSEAVQSIDEQGQLLTSVMLFAYHVSEDGTLTNGPDDAAAIAAAKRHRVLPLMTIVNFTVGDPGSDTAHAVSSRPQIGERLLQQVVLTIREKGYRGLNIDFENVLPSDREGYNRFLQRAVDMLHPLGLSVSTAVMPKTGDGDPPSYDGYDYAAHGRIADFVVLMTYEWGYRSGPPQAISPVDQMRRVLDYAVRVIPPEKISMGFEIYARDWLLPHVQGQEAETFDTAAAVDRAIRYGAEIHYNVQAQSPYFFYADEHGRQHVVWFEDARSALAKFELVKTFALRGISYWALGVSFPQNWTLLGDNFTIQKY